MTSIALAVSVTVHSLTPGCDACGSVLPDVPPELAEQWLTTHTLPVLLQVDLSINGHRSTWRRR